MKKISLSLMLLSCGIFVQAQHVSFGLKGGLNVATTTNSQGGSRDNRLGYHAGVFANILASPQFAIQPEVVYSSQGARYTLGNGQEHSLALNYVNIPVMIQALIGGGFKAQVGPQIGFLTSVTDKVGDVETGFFTSQDFKKTDVSLGVGLAYVAAGGFGVDARYNLGLTNINNAGSANVKNNVLQIGLLLQLGK